MLTINLLQALPKTPLWDRLNAKAGRIDDDAAAAKAMCVFLRPTTRWWRRGGAAIAYANDPERCSRGSIHQVDATYVNRMIGAGARQAKLGQLCAAPRCWLQRRRCKSA